jgi:hypothetical protein
LAWSPRCGGKDREYEQGISAPNARLFFQRRPSRLEQNAWNRPRTLLYTTQSNFQRCTPLSSQRQFITRTIMVIRSKPSQLGLLACRRRGVPSLDSRPSNARLTRGKAPIPKMRAFKFPVGVLLPVAVMTRYSIVQLSRGLGVWKDSRCKVSKVLLSSTSSQRLQKRN